jgi:hypothetical protein
MLDIRGKYVQPKIWRGFYMFRIYSKSGFAVKNKVEHLNDIDDHHYGYNTLGCRSFYIGNVLCRGTLRNMTIMVNLQDMDENQLTKH